MAPSILLSNVRSLFTKFDELCVLVSQKRADVVAVTESWLNESIVTSLLDIPGFTLFRTDRTLRKGGGTCLWVRNSLDPRPVDDLMLCLPDTVEGTWITIENRSILCICLYIPPGLTHDQKKRNPKSTKRCSRQLLRSCTNIRAHNHG